MKHRHGSIAALLLASLLTASELGAQVEKKKEAEKVKVEAKVKAEIRAKTIVSTQAKRAWLGIVFEDVRVPGQAAPVIVVQRVAPKSPAATAGLVDADTIVRINGAAATLETLQSLSSRLQIGDTVRVTVKRGAGEKELMIVADARPGTMVYVEGPGEFITFDDDSLRRIVRVYLDTVRANLEKIKIPHFRLEQTDSGFYFFFDDEDGRVRARRLPQWDSLQRVQRVRLDSLRHRALLHADSLRARFPAFTPSTPSAWAATVEMGQRAVAGAEFTELNPQLAEYFGGRDGLLTLRVAPGTPAARAGLRAGDVIFRVADSSVRSVAELRRAVARAAKGSELRMQVVRKDKDLELKLKKE